MSTAPDVATAVAASDTSPSPVASPPAGASKARTAGIILFSLVAATSVTLMAILLVAPLA